MAQIETLQGTGPQQGPPLARKVILELSNIGIDKKFIKFLNITMESDRCVLVREENKVSAISLKNKKIVPLNVRVDSAIMNPTKNLLGLRVKKNLQIFNLDAKTRIKSVDVAQRVLFWKWLDSNRIAYVTTKGIYHWSIDANSDPIMQCEIISEDFHSQTKILNYDCSKNGKFLFYQGIAKNPETNKMEGILRIYSMDKKEYRPKMNGHGACFANLNIDGNGDRISTLFCCIKTINENSKELIIIECDNPNPKNSFRVKSNVSWNNNKHDTDFVVAIVPSPMFQCLYAVTQAGTLLLFDMQTAKLIKSHTFPHTVFFRGIPHEPTGGMVTLDKTGQICWMGLNTNNNLDTLLSSGASKKNGNTLNHSMGVSPSMSASASHEPASLLDFGTQDFLQVNDEKKDNYNNNNDDNRSTYSNYSNDPKDGNADNLGFDILQLIEGSRQSSIAPNENSINDSVNGANNNNNIINVGMNGNANANLNSNFNGNGSVNNDGMNLGLNNDNTRNNNTMNTNINVNINMDVNENNIEQSALSVLHAINENVNECKNKMKQFYNKLEDNSNNSMPTMTQELVNDYVSLSMMQALNENAKINYQILLNEKDLAMNQLKDSNSKIDEIDKEIEKLQMEKQTLANINKNIQSKVSTLQDSLNTSEKAITMCTSMLQAKSERIDPIFAQQWQQFEENWMNWDNSEMFIWFKTMIENYDRQMSNSQQNNGNNTFDNSNSGQAINAENWQLIASKLVKRELNGNFLIICHEKELQKLGFNNGLHRSYLENQIQMLLAKYPYTQSGGPSPGQQQRLMARKSVEIGSSASPSMSPRIINAPNGTTMGNNDNNNGNGSNSSTCCMCMDRQVNTVFIPCGHACMCKQCSTEYLTNTVHTCPICRKNIQNVFDLFMT